MLKHLREFYTQMHRELAKVPISSDSLSRVAFQMMATAANRVSNDRSVKEDCKYTIFVLVLIRLTSLVLFSCICIFNGL